MKIVSFKIAKVLKNAGYPQRFISSFAWYNKEGKLFDSFIDVPMDEKDDECVAPTYLEVWLWLWRKKGILITVDSYSFDSASEADVFVNKIYQYTTNKMADPEEAIVKAVDYLVENDLIK